jgi:hypothetical protein
MSQDKSTVFSICPFPINEFKPGIHPGIFKLNPCFDENKPERLVVGTSNYVIHIGGKKQPLLIEQSSMQIARSIVQDLLDAQLWSTPEEHPGICWIQGEISLKEFLERYKEQHEEMKAVQRRWCILIVKKTQDDWNKYKNSRVVSDQARFAVRYLGIDLPEWMTVETVGLQYNKCPACSTMNDPQNAICVSCKCILDEEKFKKLKFVA